jgi:hypothetical protein
MSRSGYPGWLIFLEIKNLRASATFSAVICGRIIRARVSSIHPWKARARIILPQIIAEKVADVRRFL